MARRLLIVAAAISLAACGASAAAPARSSSSSSSSSSSASSAGATVCGPTAAKTLASSRGGRVYASGARVYGCAAGSSRSYLIGKHTNCLGGALVGPVALAGRTAAYGLMSCGIDTGSAVVVVRNLTDGKVLTQDPATTAPLGPESYQHVDSVVVRADGAVAWIATASSIVKHGHETEVHSTDAHGTRLLDHGAGVAPMSLRLDGSRLTWRDGSVTHAAKLR